MRAERRGWVSRWTLVGFGVGLAGCEAAAAAAGTVHAAGYAKAELAPVHPKAVAIPHLGSGRASDSRESGTAD